MPFYRLDDANASSAAPAAEVVHERIEVRGVEASWVGFRSGGPPQDAWRAWLGAMGKKRTYAACARQHALAHHWRGEGALRRAIAPELRMIERDFAAMVAELQAIKILTSDEARLARPCFRVDLVDERGDTSRALPDTGKLLVASFRPQG